MPGMDLSPVNQGLCPQPQPASSGLGLKEHSLSGVDCGVWVRDQYLGYFQHQTGKADDSGDAYLRIKSSTLETMTTAKV